MSTINVKSLILTIVAVFVAMSVTDFLIHGLWMRPVYAATASLWRPDMDNNPYMAWLHVGHVLASVAFSLLWAIGFAANAKITCGMKYGTTMALFSQAHTFISYAVQPLTMEIVWKWLAGGVVQGIILGIVAFLVYRPARQG